MEWQQSEKITADLVSIASWGIYEIYGIFSVPFASVNASRKRYMVLPQEQLLLASLQRTVWSKNYLFWKYSHQRSLAQVEILSHLNCLLLILGFFLFLFLFSYVTP